MGAHNDCIDFLAVAHNWRFRSLRSYNRSASEWIIILKMAADELESMCRSGVHVKQWMDE
ncbi:hypothetical protein DMX02_04195 [Pseudomonas jessenii]|nr:hypothetical protein DMX02_04195 [Pseudomonas jessenii]